MRQMGWARSRLSAPLLILRAGIQLPYCGPHGPKPFLICSRHTAGLHFPASLASGPYGRRAQWNVGRSNDCRAQTWPMEMPVPSCSHSLLFCWHSAEDPTGKTTAPGDGAEQAGESDRSEWKSQLSHLKLCDLGQVTSLPEPSFLLYKWDHDGAFLVGLEESQI